MLLSDFILFSYSNEIPSPRPLLSLSNAFLLSVYKFLVTILFQTLPSMFPRSQKLGQPHLLHLLLSFLVTPQDLYEILVYKLQTGHNCFLPYTSQFSVHRRLPVQRRVTYTAAEYIYNNHEYHPPLLLCYSSPQPHMASHW